MHIEVKWTRKNLKEELKQKRLKVNCILFSIGVLIYLYLLYIPITSSFFDNKIIFIWTLIYLVTYIVILMLSSKLYVHFTLKRNDKRTNKAYGNYVIDINEDIIDVKINGINIKYKWNEIIKYKSKKKYLFICTKEDKIGLIFKRKIFGIENFNKIKDYCDKKISL